LTEGLEVRLSAGVQFITVFKASSSALDFSQAAIQRAMVSDLPVVKRAVL